MRMEKYGLFLAMLVLEKEGGGGRRREAFGCAWFRRQCCCRKIAEPAQLWQGEVQPVSALAKGFGLWGKHSGSFSSFCAAPQQGSVTAGFVSMMLRLAGCSGAAAESCDRESSVKGLFHFWLCLAGYLDWQILGRPL